MLSYSCACFFSSPLVRMYLSRTSSMSLRRGASPTGVLRVPLAPAFTASLRTPSSLGPPMKMMGMSLFFPSARMVETILVALIFLVVLPKSMRPKDWKRALCNAL